MEERVERNLSERGAAPNARQLDLYWLNVITIRWDEKLSAQVCPLLNYSGRFRTAWSSCKDAPLEFLTRKDCIKYEPTN